MFGPGGTYPDPEALSQALTVQFGFDQAAQLKTWCEQEGIEFMASVFDLERFKWMESLGVSRHKVASRVVQDRELCEHILATGLETFISLGFWDGQGVPYPCSNARYLYCVPKYPCPYEDICLPQGFADSIYEGFSDHTIGIEAALVAVGRGARIIEKHFTLEHNLPRPDHQASLEPAELKAMVTAIRNIKVALGDGIKRLTPSEARNKPIVRKSLVARQAIKAGEVFTAENITTKRPGTGISPMRWDEVLGKTAQRDFLADELIEL